MIEKYDVKTIIELLEKDFEPALIAFELKIPIEYVNQCQDIYKKRKAEIESKSKKIPKDILDILDKEKSKIKNILVKSENKFESMKRRYRQLLKISNPKIIDKEVETPQDKEKINNTIDKMNVILSDIPLSDKAEKQKCIEKILYLVQKIDDLDLSLEQLEEIYLNINSDEIKAIKIVSKYMRDLLEKERQKISTKITLSIDKAYSETEDIETLENLRQKSRIYKKYNTNLEYNIINKIQRLLLNNYENQQLEILKPILDNINSPNFDIDKAKQIISNLAKENITTRTKNKFSLTEDEERDRIIKDIYRILKSKADKYPITNPYQSINNLEKLGSEETGTIIDTVIHNLISNNQIELVKEVSKKYNLTSNLRKEITKAELSSNIVATLKSGKLSQEDKYLFLKNLDEILFKENIDSKNLIIGKKKDGNPIKLSDIYDDKKARNH